MKLRGFWQLAGRARYRARFSRIFLKKEERLSSDVKPRVVEALREILMNPHVGVPLVDGLKGLWRVRIGKYRVLLLTVQPSRLNEI